MRPITVIGGPYAAGNVALIAASQAPTSGTPLTLTGTQPDKPRRIVITAGADAVTTRTFTLVGTNWSGQPWTEVIAIPTGAGATVSSLDYATITTATPTGSGWSANVSVGTSTSGTNTPVASSAWLRLDDYGFAPVQISVEVTGTANYTVECSDDDINAVAPSTVVAPSAAVWIAPDSNLTSKTASAQDSLAAKPMWLRLTINSATATSGSSSMAVIQPGGKGG
jgi:hypothetical protein